MADVVSLAVRNYSEILHKVKDPAVDNWLFMNSPAPVVTVLMMYLVFVLKVGPEFMEKRAAYNLKKLMIIYNVYQIVFNIYFLSKIRFVHNLGEVLLKCRFEESPIYAAVVGDGAWWFLISKVIDFMDTVLFVLRKKQSQVTFLHVYHHSSTMIVTWAYLKLLPCEQGVVLSLTNSFVHVIMYSYYLLAAMGPQYQKYLWWKKYVTQLQLLQFCFMLFYLLYTVVRGCYLPVAATVFFFIFIGIYLNLFVKFYLTKYQRSNKMTKIQSAKKE